MHRESELLNYFALHVGFLMGWQSDQSQSKHGGCCPTATFCDRLHCSRHDGQFETVPTRTRSLPLRVTESLDVAHRALISTAATPALSRPEPVK
jgi:hypothetical protein